MFNKDEYVKALTILFDLDKQSGKELGKLSKETLDKLYQGQIKNAKSYQEMASEYYGNSVKTGRK